MSAPASVEVPADAAVVASAALPDAAPAPAETAAAAAQKKKKSKKRKTAASWTAPKENPWIYVTGLPPDVTDSELADHFRKVGILKTDFESKKPKIKLYKNVDGGDASLCFLKEASVPLSITILDGVELRPGFPLTVTQAVFDKKEGVVVDRKQTQDARKAAKLKELEQSALLSWVSDEEDGDDVTGGLRVVVLRNLFGPADAAEPGFVTDMEEDIREECAKLGEVQKVTVFPNHPAGIVSVKFKRPGAATLCIERMNGRWFSQRQVACEFWDGKTDYSKHAEPADEKKRLDAFGDWLDAQSDEEETAAAK